MSLLIICSVGVTICVMLLLFVMFSTIMLVFFCVYAHMILSCQSLMTYTFYLSYAFYSSCALTFLFCVVICVYENDSIQMEPPESEDSKDDESEVSESLDEELSYLDFLCFPPMFNNLIDVPKFKNIKSKIFVSPTLYNYV